DEMRRSQNEQLPGEPFGRHQAVPLPEIVQVVSSSGTTGNPLYYALTAADLEVWRQAIAGAFFTAGIRPGDVVAHLVGLPGVAGGLPYADGFRTIGAALAWLGGFPTERILHSIRRLRPPPCSPPPPSGPTSPITAPSSSARPPPRSGCASCSGAASPASA